jgi:hypothetical protein
VNPFRFSVDLSVVAALSARPFFARAGVFLFEKSFSAEYIIGCGFIWSGRDAVPGRPRDFFTD